ncbi:MAG TPA: 3',5'-cyclic-AMP phosphodiesterase [Gammaproteobacteria bacterium]|nr:3',5'-cyclic-AMP phosphodiesterase [Gammaproteobacteria bacterium]
MRQEQHQQHQPPSQTPINIIQISDIHLMADENGALLGVKTQESLQAVIDLIKHNETAINFVLLTGDLSQDGSYASYQRLATLLQPLSVPVYYVPGNHDKEKEMARAYPHGAIVTDKHIKLPHWQIILLDSHKPGAVEGQLPTTQLDYLEDCLQTCPDHAIVVFHHQPTPVHCLWLDKIGIKEPAAFWQIIKKHAQVKIILFGHIHQEFFHTVQGIPCYAVPSTCIQFKRKQDHFGLEYLTPGYRWLRLYDDGHFETGVKRVAHYIGVFEKDATGY